MGKKTNNNKSFWKNLFEVIYIPLFLYILYIIIIEGLGVRTMLINYSIYLTIFGFLFTIFIFGFAGYRAAKLSDLKIKPVIAGLFVGLIGSLISFGISMIIIYVFPEIMLEQAKAAIAGSEVELGEGFVEMGKTFAIIGGVVGTLFTSGFGALFGFIGGAIGRK